jgi:hypothetical protein
LCKYLGLQALTPIFLLRNPPGFAFVEFEDSRDAEDSVKGLDGTRVCGVSEAPSSRWRILLRVARWFVFKQKSQFG